MRGGAFESADFLFFMKNLRYIKNTGQDDGTPGLDLNVTHVWKQGFTGKGSVQTKANILQNILNFSTKHSNILTEFRFLN